MGVLDKFLDILKLNDDYEDDDYLDDFDDDYEDDYDQKKSKKPNLFNKSSKYEDNHGYEDEPTNKRTTSSNRFSSSNNNGGKVTPIRNTATPSHSGNGMGVCVIKPTSIDDGREICETLLEGRTVILNLEGLDLEIAQRIIDFTSGAAYAMKGNLQKISNYIFLVTPDNVDISGDLQNLLGNSFDVSSMRTRF